MPVQEKNLGARIFRNITKFINSDVIPYAGNSTVNGSYSSCMNR